MSHVLNGRILARSSDDVVEPIAGETVLFYRVPEGENGAFRVRSHEDVRKREYLLLGQSRTDESGAFRIDLDGPTLLGHRGTTRKYDGGPLEVEIYCRGVGSEAEPCQFSIGHKSPEWTGEGDDRTASFEHEVSAAHWSEVRTALDLWTITGRLVTAGGGSLAGLRVSAYDADPVRDDFLGTADVEGDGTFRIDYPGSRFRPTPVMGVDVEGGGPEVYFDVQAADGTVIYKEPSSRGRKPDRARAPNWFEVELAIDAPSTGTRAPTPPAVA